MEEENKAMRFAMHLAWQDFTMGTASIDEIEVEFEVAFKAAWRAAKMHELGFEIEEEYEAHFNSVNVLAHTPLTMGERRLCVKVNIHR